MTPAEHVKRVRQVAFQLYRADRGLGMPRDYQLVLRLRTHLDQVTTEAVAAIHDAFVNGPLSIAEAVEALNDIGEDEAVRVVSEWADGAEAGRHYSPFFRGECEACGKTAWLCSGDVAACGPCSGDAERDEAYDLPLYAPDPEQV